MFNNKSIYSKILIEEDKNIIEALNKLNAINLDDDISRLILFVINYNGSIIGSLTDGDIRRSLIKEKNLNKKVKDICNRNFVKIYETSDYINLKNFSIKIF